MSHVKEKTLDYKTCSWLRGYQNTKKHKLLNLKYTANVRLHVNKLRPKKDSELIRLKLQLFKLVELLALKEI